MSGKLTLGTLRRRAIAGSLLPQTTLGRSLAAAGFVQADPIRAPARAQDLILRHRVAGYRVGDLERRFARLGLEEDFLYAYGFMPRDTIRLLHPRHNPDSADGRHVPDGMAAEVLAFVRDRGATHPADLEARFGRERAVNGWGGFSKATTRALQSLHYHGLLRVARRRDGIRIYEAARTTFEPLTPAERMRRLVLLVVRILAPMPRASLAATFGLLSRGAPGLGGWRGTVEGLLKSGELEAGDVDGVGYLWPATHVAAWQRSGRREVRFLAPFDPIVWDRRRFEHLWGWPYRFEAYTQAARRRFGYYAMPLLWGDQVIGWVNVSMAQGSVDVECGFIDRLPKEPGFRRAFDAEVARMEDFLAR
jgi:uncharacterized protein YcaQ